MRASTASSCWACGDARRGIVHVIGPELGLTQPGMTIVCGDSHTSTHGAFGTLAFGIGTTEVAHVFATQCLLQRKPKTLAIAVEGALAAGVGAKDLVLAIIGRIGVAGGARQAIEYRGATIRALSMEERMTVCNMSIEAGARAGMIAPDEMTFDYLRGRPRAPAGADFDARGRALARGRGRCGRGLRSRGRVRRGGDRADDQLRHEPGHGDADRRRDPGGRRQRCAGAALHGPRGGRRRCSGARCRSSSSAAARMRGSRTCARRRPCCAGGASRSGLRVLVVPGSQQVKQAAEAEGLHRVFLDAGAEWRESGCSMCVGINGDVAAPGEYVVSTSNRNFEGRQGQGVRTLLASPVTAAAAAVTGRVTDPREFVR